MRKLLFMVESDKLLLVCFTKELLQVLRTLLTVLCYIRRYVLCIGSDKTRDGGIVPYLTSCMLQVQLYDYLGM